MNLNLETNFSKELHCSNNRMVSLFSICKKSKKSISNTKKVLKIKINKSEDWKENGRKLRNNTLKQLLENDK